MNRQERDTICGVAERSQLSYTRVLGYAVRIDGYVFFDYGQATAFVNKRLNRTIVPHAPLAHAPHSSIAGILRECLGRACAMPDAKTAPSIGLFHGKNPVMTFVLGGLVTAAVLAILYAAKNYTGTEATTESGASAVRYKSAVRADDVSRPQPLYNVTTMKSSRASELPSAEAEQLRSNHNSETILFKGIAGTKALVQLTRFGESTLHNRQLAQGEQVLGHWIVESITIRPASLNLRNEQTGDQIELQLNDSARLPRG